MTEKGVFDENDQGSVRLQLRYPRPNLKRKRVTSVALSISILAQRCAAQHKE
jgi:hypothetical protein